MNQFKRAQVVILPTQNELINKSDYIEIVSGLGIKLFTQENDFKGNINLYIISDDKIKENDWYYDDKFKHVTQNKGQMLKSHYKECCKKIIATTDTSLGKNIHFIDSKNNKANQKFESLPQPSQQFIEKYIESFNKCEIITDVLIEYEELYNDYGETNIFDLVCTNHSKILKLKVNPKDNTITIKKLKESWNREEISELLFQLKKDIINNNHAQITGWNINEWIKENL